MKRLTILGLLMILLINPALACVTNSVKVYSNFDKGITQSYLIKEAKYSIIANNSLYYHAHNDSSMNIKMSDDYLILHSLNESTNWTRVIEEELSYLYYRNATNLLMEEITFISKQGCCGEYESGNYVMPDVACSESFTVPIIKDDLTWIGVLLSFLPILAYAIYLIRDEWKKYAVLCIGVIGWLVAYSIRTPLLSLFGNDLITLILAASLMSGLFEEGIRFILFKLVEINRKNPLILGLGWGLGEAVLIYSLPLSHLLLTNQPTSLINSLPGAVERLSATLLHVSLTMLVRKSLKNKRLLLLSMLIHSLFNLIIILTLNYFSLNVWLLQGIILLLSICVSLIVFKLKGFKNVKFKK